MKWKLIKEANKTPSDQKSIDGSFNGDVSDEKFTPTVEFTKAVYRKMNKELFFGCLPNEDELTFEISHSVRGGFAGITIAERDVVTRQINVKKLVLNGVLTFTLHNWMETILHEMIHICDYVNFPKHFDNDDYDAHGDWFMKEGERFKKFGFNVSKTCRAEHGVDMDNKKVKDTMNKELFIQIGKTNDGFPEIFKILSKNKDKCLSVLKKRRYKKVVILTSSNPKSVELKTLRPSNEMNIRVYHMDESFREKYGPFKKVEVVDLTSMVLESDEANDETLNTLRNIGGMVYAKKINDRIYEICLS